MLGTGNAAVTECYNTCFALREKEQYFLVDAGGGNGILSRLKSAGIDHRNIHTIFVTHKHIDHILGVIWLIRMICQDINKGLYDGDLVIYGHDEVIGLLFKMSKDLLQKKQSDLLGKRVHLVTVADGDKKEILGKPTAFFDIKATKAKQFGFCMEYEKVKNLLLYHTEDKNIKNRKTLYTAEGSRYFDGNIFVPDDLEKFTL